MFTTTTITIILLSLTTIIFIYTTVNLLRKLEAREIFDEQQEKRSNILLATMRKLDNKKMFEKDDEVGQLFIQIKEIIEKYMNR